MRVSRIRMIFMTFSCKFEQKKKHQLPRRVNRNDKEEVLGKYTAKSSEMNSKVDNTPIFWLGSHGSITMSNLSILRFCWFCVVPFVI